MPGQQRNPEEARRRRSAAQQRQQAMRAAADARTQDPAQQAARQAAIEAALQRQAKYKGGVGLQAGWRDPTWLIPRLGIAVVALFAIGLLAWFATKVSAPEKKKVDPQVQFVRDVSLLRRTILALPPWDRDLREDGSLTGNDVKKAVSGPEYELRLGHLAKNGLRDSEDREYVFTVDMSRGRRDRFDRDPVGQVVVYPRGESATGPRTIFVDLKWKKPEGRALETFVRRDTARVERSFDDARREYAKSMMRRMGRVPGKDIPGKEKPRMREERETGERKIVEGKELSAEEKAALKEEARKEKMGLAKDLTPEEKAALKEEMGLDKDR